VLYIATRINQFILLTEPNRTQSYAETIIIRTALQPITRQERAQRLVYPHSAASVRHRKRTTALLRDQKSCDARCSTFAAPER